MSVRKLVGVVLGGIVTAGVAAWLIAPERLRLVAGDLPEPVVLATVFLFVTVAWLGAMWVFAKVAYRLWQRIGPRLSWALRLVFPDSPLIRFAAGVMLFIAIVIVLIGALPTLIGTLGGDGGAIGFAQELNDRGLNTDWNDIVDGDAIAGTAVCQGEQVGLADGDGDGIPDDWERAGESPGGAALPDADPNHKDLYVQVNHGSNVAPLSPAEKSQLRRVWARMPVQNPDGTTGIRIHLDDDSERAGSLGQPFEFSDPGAHAQFYTEEHLGARQCLYHQVTYGRTERNGTVGFGSMPGYAVIADGRTLDAYEGNVSFRVGVTTHELLHNVAGRVNGSPHTPEGWLAGGPDQEYLSAATATDLNASGLFGPA